MKIDSVLPAADKIIHGLDGKTHPEIRAKNRAIRDSTKALRVELMAAIAEISRLRAENVRLSDILESRMRQL